MTWRERLIGVALAGGLVASCSSGGGTIDGSTIDGFQFPPCNGVSDPCCLQPDSGACFDSRHPEAGIPDAAPARDGEPNQ
jgi:hypothetical protein